MDKIRFTNKSVDDLTRIWNYTYSEWSESQADKYYNMLIDSCEELANNPTSGRSYPQITKALFGFHAGRHIIFYRLTEDNFVEITRILHERMDLKNRLKE